LDRSRQWRNFLPGNFDRCDKLLTIGFDKNSPPQLRRGGCDTKKNIASASSDGADGVVLVRRSDSEANTTPSAREEVASQLFFDARIHPSSAEEGKGTRL
jgi:hypothetical protein